MSIDKGGVLRDNRGAEGETVARQADGQTSDKTGGNKIKQEECGESMDFTRLAPGLF